MLGHSTHLEGGLIGSVCRLFGKVFAHCHVPQHMGMQFLSRKLETFTGVDECEAPGPAVPLEPAVDGGRRPCALLRGARPHDHLL